MHAKTALLRIDRARRALDDLKEVPLPPSTLRAVASFSDLLGSFVPAQFERLDPQPGPATRELSFEDAVGPRLRVLAGQRDDRTEQALES